MLYLGDVRQLFKEIPDNSIDLVVTDPPYKIVQGGRTKDMGHGGIMAMDNKDVSKGKMFEQNDIKFSEWLPEVYRVLKPRTNAYIMTNGRNIAELQAAAEDAGLHYQNLLVWKKRTKTPNRYWMQTCEFILMLSKRPARSIHDMGKENFFQYDSKRGNRLHPSEKPIDLMADLIVESSSIGETVLDPFMGSGTTGVAALRLSREFIGMEVDPKFFEVAKQRLGK